MSLLLITIFILSLFYLSQQIQDNMLLRVFWSGGLLFCYYQVASTFLLLIHALNLWTAWLILLLPLGLKLLQNTSLSSKRSPSQLKDLWYFFPALMGYLYHASPPPWMRDSLTYHLALARQYAKEQHFVQTDEVIFAYFPQGWQSILALFHALDPTSHPLFNPRYITVFLSITMAMGLAGYLKNLKVSKGWYIGTAYLLLLTPTMMEFGTSCYVQTWLMMLLLMTGLGIINRYPPVFIVFLISLIISVKYSGLFLPLLLLPYLLKRLSKSTILTFLIFGSPFYIRNYYIKGNPIFPLGWSIFGGEGWDAWRAMAYDITLKNYGMGREWLDFVLLPIRIFWTQDLEYGFQGSLGIGFLGLILWTSWHHLNIRRAHFWLIWICIGWCILWTVQVQQIRFLMPIIPLLLLVCTATIAPIHPKKWPIPLIVSVLWCLPAIQTLQQKQHSDVYWKQGEELYLQGQLPENYPVYQYLNHHMSQRHTVWLVWMRGYHYYLELPTRIDNVFGAYRFEELLWNSPSTKSFLQSLKEQNIDTIVINWRFFLVNENADRLENGATAILQERFRQLIQDQVLIAEKQFGPVWIYSVSSSIDSSDRDEK